MNTLHWLRGAGVVALATALTASAKAQSLPDPLTGVTRVAVLASFDAYNGDPPSGISQGRLQTLLELRLRTAGLRVVSGTEGRNAPGPNPYVRLQVQTLQTRSQGGTVTGYAYRIDLGAWLFTSVPFNHATAALQLWFDGTMAVASPEAAPADIERIVGELTDSFLNAWLRANPR